MRLAELAAADATFAVAGGACHSLRAQLLERRRLDPGVVGGRAGMINLENVRILMDPHKSPRTRDCFGTIPLSHETHATASPRMGVARGLVGGGAEFAGDCRRVRA